MYQSNEQRFSDFLKPYKASYIASVIMAILSVFFGLAPYYILYHLLVGVLPIKLLLQDLFLFL